jgi:hypothetical protein
MKIIRQGDEMATEPLESQKGYSEDVDGKIRTQLQQFDRRVMPHNET